MLFVQRLRYAKRPSRGKRILVVGFSLQGGQVIQARRALLGDGFLFADFGGLYAADVV